MQDGFTALWQRLASTKMEAVEPPGDFGFYDPDGVRIWGPEYFRSGNHPGHLPGPGGMIHQTRAVQQDWITFSRGLAWQQWEAWEEERRKNDSKNLLDSVTDYTR